jgi:hypothetical protein
MVHVCSCIDGSCEICGVMMECLTELGIKPGPLFVVFRSDS